jgi:hypothetical protein
LSTDEERTVGAVVSLAVLLNLMAVVLVRAIVISVAFPVVGR